MAAKKASATKAKRRKAGPADPPKAVLDAAFKLAVLQGWNATTMSDIARESGLALADLRAMHGSKLGILAAAMRRTDEAVLAGTDQDIAEEPVKDRLFDVLIRRLDAMQQDREAIAAIALDLRRDPGALACFMAGPFRTSMRWMLDAAQIEPWGPFSGLQIKGLGVVYLSVLRVWLNDDSADLSATMAVLDKALGRVDDLVAMLKRGPRLPRRRRDEEEQEESAAAH
jgi:ubiquinone biosynthesis protein COQ9